MSEHSTALYTRATLGFVRVAAISPELRVADVGFNTQKTIEAMRAAAAQGVQLAVFPELGLTAYTCADLFSQTLLLDRARAALEEVAAVAGQINLAAIVGLPLQVLGRLFNCVALVAGGQIVGIVPKTFLPSTNEFYESRWFTSGKQGTPPTLRFPHQVGAEEVPFGPDLLLRAHNMPDCMLGIEICEDLWAVNPPSGNMALAGATILTNSSASNELLSKAEYRYDLVRQQSARGLAAYIYAGVGAGESTTDLVFAGHALVAENGSLLAETERFHFDTQMVVVDIDVQRLVNERVKNSSFSQAGLITGYRIFDFDLPRAAEPMPVPVIRPQLTRLPFVPSDPQRRAHNCREIFHIQATGLAKRLRHTGSQKVVIGVSGGLDSTLALLVIANAFDRLGLARNGIVAITMPGFGTTSRTRSNAERLAELLGAELRVIPIGEAVRGHFRDIGHDENKHDVTYENAQARERTQILMDVANMFGGLVVGTGDLSEAALGWMTFNGDHMSMYHVNAGVPKTLVRYLVAWCAEELFSGETSVVLHDIVATPITPELLPLGKDNALEQKTEDTIGPYALHDFFLYQVLRHQFPPSKVFFLAQQAFTGEYTPATVLQWLRVFYLRFFSQQFKRSAMPDGPKVGTVALSPRGDWRMPSDASSAEWLRAVDEIQVAVQSEQFAASAADKAPRDVVRA